MPLLGKAAQTLKSAGRALVQSEQFSLHKEQAVGFPIGAVGRLISGGQHGRQATPGIFRLFPAPRRSKASDLLKILGQELPELYELPHNLPHGMFTQLMELSDRGGSPALRTRADKYRALAERA